MKASPVPETVLDDVAKLLGSDVNSIKSKWPEFYASVESCENCGRQLDFFDFVKTAHDLGVHSKEYMANFFLGGDSMEKNLSTVMACSACGKKHPVDVMYRYGGPRICSGSG